MSGQSVAHTNTRPLWAIDPEVARAITVALESYREQQRQIAQALAEPLRAWRLVADELGAVRVRTVPRPQPQPQLPAWLAEAPECVWRAWLDGPVE